MTGTLFTIWFLYLTRYNDVAMCENENAPEIYRVVRQTTVGAIQIVLTVSLCGLRVLLVMRS